MAQRISMVSGVAQVQVYGRAEVRRAHPARPARLASRGVGIDEVARRHRSRQRQPAHRHALRALQAFTVQANGQLFKAADYRKLIVAYRNGRPVRLEELGPWWTASRTTRPGPGSDQNTSALRPGHPAPAGRTNAVEVSDRVKALLPVFRSQIPASVDLQVHRDRADSIRASVNDVKFTLLLTLFLVILVIFLFLRNVSATIIPSLALPLSIIGTFAVMYLFGYSLDNLSLMALTLSVGFVVDDAIVMLENIVRHMEMGEPPMEAALNGSKEIGFTIISMTISLAAVFIPILFMGGILGRLFHEFAVTIGAAILVSGFVSLTLTPLLSSRFLKHQEDVHHGRLYEVHRADVRRHARLLRARPALVSSTSASRAGPFCVVLVLTAWLFMCRSPRASCPARTRAGSCRHRAPSKASPSTPSWPTTRRRERDPQKEPATLTPSFRPWAEASRATRARPSHTVQTAARAKAYGGSG